MLAVITTRCYRDSRETRALALRESAFITNNNDDINKDHGNY